MGFSHVCTTSKNILIEAKDQVKRDFTAIAVESGKFYSLYARTAWNFRKLKPLHDELKRKGYFKSPDYTLAKEKTIGVGFFTGTTLIAGVAMLVVTGTNETMNSIVGSAGFFGGMACAVSVPIHTRFATLERLRSEMGDSNFASFAHSWNESTKI